MTKKMSAESISSQKTDKLIKDAITGHNTIKKRIQAAAVQILCHAANHGDWTKANDLVAGLSNGSVRRDTLVEWFKVYGGLKHDDEKFVGWHNANFIKKRLDEAKAKDWTQCKKEKPPFEARSGAAITAAYFTQLESNLKKAEKAGVEADYTIETVAKIRKLLGSLEVESLDTVDQTITA